MGGGARRLTTMVFGLAFVTGRRPSVMIDDPAGAYHVICECVALSAGGLTLGTHLLFVYTLIPILFFFY